MKVPESTDALYSVADLAKLFGVTKETVFRWNSDGMSPKRIVIGRRVYYRHADVQAWIGTRESK